MKKMPLCVDTIQLAPAGQYFVNTKTGFFKKMGYSFKRLIVSFFDDYTVNTENGEKEKALKLWVNWGRDQATSLDTLIRDSFTEQTGIHVDVQITNASLVNGILSGNFPDMALHMTRTEPVNLGIRGALADLNQFDDLNDALKSFSPTRRCPMNITESCTLCPIRRPSICFSTGRTFSKIWGLPFRKLG